MNAYEFLSTKKTDMYRWWQAADRDPSGREVLVDVSVYCKVWRGKVRERMTHTSWRSDDSVKNTKLSVNLSCGCCHFPITSQERFCKST